MKKTAEEMAAEQREISVSEFFEKNRHLLGFDNSAKALLIVVKEAVDNSLDACEDAGELPDIIVKIKVLSEDRIKVAVQDNGPGIVKAQIPKIFGKLLYGSKFGRMVQGRGQQGIGISAALLYSQLTTGKPMLIRSTTGKDKKVHEMKIRMDTTRNEPQILSDVVYEKNFPEHGTYIEMEIEGKYRKGARSVDEYIKQTAIANPHAKFVYKVDKTQITYPRVTKEFPKKACAIKPHPHGVELGVFERMINRTKARSVLSFITSDFSRVGSTTAKQVLKLSKVKPDTKASNVNHQELEKIWRNLQKAKIMNPPLICISPISEDVLQKSVEKDLKPEFAVATTRPPSVYRGNPFQIECCIAYGGELSPKSSADIMRFANKVPLLYQASSCAITKAIKNINWRLYHIDQQGGMPYGPLTIIVHMASVWIPYTSESKEAIDPYPEIEKEIKLSIQECARKLQRYLSGKRRRQLDAQRKGLFEKFLPEIVNNLSILSGESKDKIKKDLEKLINKGVLDENKGKD